MRRFLGFILAMLFMSLPAAVRAEKLDAPDNEYVNVPGMKTHKSCVHAVPAGVVVDGARVEECKYKPRKNDKVPGISDWVEFIQLKNMNGYGISDFSRISSNMVVPALPRTNWSQTTDSFQALTSTSWLMQNVLQYTTIWGYASSYTMQPWLVHVSGTAYYGTPSSIVWPGEVVSTSITSANGVRWYITYSVSGDTSRSATLYIDLPGVHFNTAYLGVLEAHNVTTCGNLPGTTWYASSHVYQPGPTWAQSNEINSNYRWTYFTNDWLGCTYSPLATWDGRAWTGRITGE